MTLVVLGMESLTSFKWQLKDNGHRQKRKVQEKHDSSEQLGQSPSLAVNRENNHHKHSNENEY